jgi:hypothetical protein
MAVETYDKFVTLAKRLITQYGRVATFDMLSAGPIDIGKPWRGPGDPMVTATVDTRAVFVSTSTNVLGKSWVQADLLARVSDVCLVAPVPGYDLRNTNRITSQGVSYIVEWAQELNPGIQPVLFYFGVKR